MSKKKDPNEHAKHVLDTVTGEKPNIPPKEKNPAAVALGKLGGAKGGRARADNLTSDQKSKIASNAAKARWAKKES